MSRYVYARPYTNPTTDWMVVPHPTARHEDGEPKYTVGVVVQPDAIVRMVASGDPEAQELAGAFARDGIAYRYHTSMPCFDEQEDADEYIEQLAESFERDYDDYLDENRYEIARMERYEAWRNEY